MTFLEWNDKLAAHFFCREMAGRQVFLFVTERLLDTLGRETGDTWRDFVQAVKAGHGWRPPRNLTLCQKAKHCLETWKGRGLRYPAYIAYLGLFVLAAGREGDFPPASYYPRLWDVLREDPHQPPPPGFNEMHLLWEALEVWSCVERRGELGRFEVRRAGGRAHVDIPRSQTVLSDEELQALPELFAAAGLDPLSPPPELELARLLAQQGRKRLRERTIQLLEKPSCDDRDLAQILRELLRDQLAEWDGQVVVSPVSDGAGPEREVLGSLRLHLTLERPAKRAKAGLVCALPRRFPDYGLRLRHENAVWSCREATPLYSSPLADANTRSPLDASAFDWRNGIELEEEHLGWHFRWPSTPARVLERGEGHRVRGFIEVRCLTRNTPFLLAVPRECSDGVAKWGSSDCRDFRLLDLRHGLPEGWVLFESAGASSDEGIRRMFPHLAFPLAVRLSLRGLRVNRRNEFFRFAPPEVFVEGLTEGDRVCANGQELAVEEGRAKLPHTILREERTVQIELRRGPEVLRKQPFDLVDDYVWRGQLPGQVFDQFGLPACGVASGVAGSLLVDVTLPATPFLLRPSFFRRRRVYFIGREPGQIVSYPKEPLPDEWCPVWAIPMGQQGEAEFCGVDIESSQPSSRKPADPALKRSIREWKKILYYKSRRIIPPRDKEERDLWRAYFRVAKNV